MSRLVLDASADASIGEDMRAVNMDAVPGSL